MAYQYPFFDPKLPLKERIQDLISRLTIEEKAGLIPTKNKAIERLNVPAWTMGAEGAHGFIDREGQSTTFPQTIGLASGWDRTLLKKVGETCATEARVYYQKRGKTEGLAIWSPTIDLERDPRWGRTEEGYGEDPFLTSELSSCYIRGAQGDDPFYLRVSCGPKHFFANNNELDRGSCSCSVPERCLNEYYLVPFKAAIQKAKAVSMMTAYNEVNGIPMNLHPIINEKVKGEWGLEGHLVTDGGDFFSTVSQHHYFDTHEEAMSASLKNGSDSMNDDADRVITVVLETLKKNLLSEKELDKHLERILAVRFRLGHFDPPGFCPYDSINESDLLKPEYKTLAREAVRKSVVLLKNENKLLPLKPETVNEKIAVIGPLANELHNDFYAGLTSYNVTPLDGILETYGGEKVEYTDTRDIVYFNTADGRPLVMKDQLNKDNTSGKILSVGTKGEEPARFFREDWGWGVWTFAHTENDFLLEVPYHRPSPDKIEENSELTVVAGGKNTPLMWFNRIVFNTIPQGDDLFLLRTYDNRRLVMPETGTGHIALSDSDQGGRSELFRITVEKDGLSAAEKAAASAGQVIFVAGNDPMINGREGFDRPGLDLPPHQEEMIDRITNVNPKTVLVLLSGYPFTCKKIAGKVPAILWMAHGIQETGHGLTDVLSGSYSPAGRLPLTWYENENQLPPMMEYDIISAGSTYQYFLGPVLYPFGHGLSYSDFIYSELNISKTTANKNETVVVSFKLKNSGSVAAEEVPQMYVSFSGSAFKRPLLSLKGFERILLQPGEEKIVSFDLPAKELAVWEPFNGEFILEKGVCKVQIGSSSKDIRLSASFDIQGDPPLKREAKQIIYAERFDTYSNCYLHEKRGSGIPAVFAKEDKAWIHFAQVNFSDDTSGFKNCFSAVVQGAPGSRIEIRLDAPDGFLAGTIAVPNTGDISFYPLVKPYSPKCRPVWANVKRSLEKISGAHDLYIVFYGKTALWSFEFGYVQME